MEWYIGFHAPYVRNLKGRIDPRGFFGHCEAWTCNADGTWLFIDPQGSGARLLIEHRHDDVLDQINARLMLCETVLCIEAQDEFRLNLHGPLNCASFCGYLIGVRALFPATLKAKLLRKGARIVHETQRKRRGQSCTPA